MSVVSTRRDSGVRPAYNLLICLPTMDTIYFEWDQVPVRTLSLHEVLEEFIKHHKLDPKTEHRFRTSFKRIDEIKPNADTSNFGKKDLLLLQNYLTDKYDRRYINRFTTDIRRVFKWAALFDLVSNAKSHELTLVPQLQKGDRRCRENKKRTNVPDEYVEAFQKHCRRPVTADMVELESIHGMRPGKVCNLKPCMIDFKYDGENWLAQPEEHKTAGKGFTRSFVLCKRSQEILKKYMQDDPNRHFFLNDKGNPFTPNVFGKAVKKVIDKHGLQKFVPYQLRHNAATKTAMEHGREYAQELLGHAKPEMTDNYIHDPTLGTEKIQKLAVERNRKFAPPPSPEYPEPRILRIFRGS